MPGTNTATPSGAVDPNNKIAAGQKILVIKTPKGVYIRTSDGKMFAVRSKLGESGDGGDGEGALSSAVSLGGGASTTTTMTASSVSSGLWIMFIVGLLSDNVDHPQRWNVTTSMVGVTHIHPDTHQ